MSLSAADLSPTSAGSDTRATYVVVWEWESRPSNVAAGVTGSGAGVRRWRPYTPEVTQLLERAHAKKLNKIYLKDADPLLSDYCVDLTSFEQRCEPTGAVYSVRREFYSGTSSPAGKGARWEWGTGGGGGGGGGNLVSAASSPLNADVVGEDDWHVYDMEVQEVRVSTTSQN